MSATQKPNRIGPKISRVRELRGMKQEALAIELGMSQQAVSAMEKKDTIESELLTQVAEILGVTPEAIENFDEDNVINYFNTFNDNSGAGAYSSNPAYTFNPLDKLIEAYEENKKLYERLLEAEKEKIAYLEKLLKG
ncbi:MULTISPECIES: helix-turn-helix transcriptional regulator [Olivibacter]|uniref:Helix-turn-helix transcriptional regulator n=1 Tax=Olivibacter jilunii TaxID=985016 RepID=A0ABW6B8M6_9SPHI